MPTPSNVHEEIVGWMQKPERRFHFQCMTATTGDVEAWCQIEFAVYHYRFHNISLEEDIHMRDQHVYTDNTLKAATWTIAPIPARKQKGVIIELKVESKTQKLRDFAKIVAMEQVKLSRLLKPAYAGYDVGVYAIAFTKGTQARLETNGMREVREARINLGTEEEFMGLYVWSGSLDGQDTRDVLNEYIIKTTAVQTMPLNFGSGSS